MTEQELELLQKKLAILTLEHRDLDDVINRLSDDPSVDQMQMKRMKRRKLHLKDEINLLHNLLIPNIIA